MGQRILQFIAAAQLVILTVVLYDLHLAFQLPPLIHWIVLGATVPIGVLIAWPVSRSTRIVRRAVISVVLVAWWQASVGALTLAGWETLRVGVAFWGTLVAFFLGLGWTVWFVDRSTKRYDQRRLVSAVSPESVAERPHFDGGWNPFDLRACYYSLDWNPLSRRAWFYFGWLRAGTPNRSGRSAKLDQSVATIGVYALSFFLILAVLTSLQGCQEIYELPAGGGQKQIVAQKVQVKKVIRKKYIINPFSVILFQVRNIDDVKLNLKQITKHNYTVGYGQGQGAGFAGGTNRGKVRFIRLQYNGGDWDQDYGVGADLNMLVEYGLRTRQKVEKRTESRRILQLRNFPIGKSPPFVYVTGQQGISVTNTEIKVLREYLLDKHGMIFCDNGGSRRFHYAFLSLMSRVLPDVRPVPVPLDDPIHRSPYSIPFLPYVSPHGGKDALGWFKDGRWVCYYHPGDINDAWCDGHAGVTAEVWEACYQLGTNVIFYANANYSKWLQARKSKKK